jgi:hypothetical protein
VNDGDQPISRRPLRASPPASAERVIRELADLFVRIGAKVASFDLLLFFSKQRLYVVETGQYLISLGT